MSMREPPPGAERASLLARLDASMRREQERQIRDLAVTTVYSYNQIRAMLRDWVEYLIPMFARGLKKSQPILEQVENANTPHRHGVEAQRSPYGPRPHGHGGGRPA